MKTIFLLVIILISGVGTNSGAQTLCPSGVMCYQVPKFNSGSPSSSSVQINVFSQCAYVNNESTSSDLHVPTNTSAEWLAFINSVNAGQVPNVSISCCPTTTNYTSTTTYTPQIACPTAVVSAWGGGGGGASKISGTARPGGSGGYAKHTVTALSSASSYNITVATGGACNRTAGTGGYAGGTGGTSNTCSVGTAGGGTGTGGNAGTKVGSGCNGGAGKWGGAGGGGGASNSLFGAGGGGATTFSNSGNTTYYLVAGGGGGAGAGDQGTAGTGGAACGNGATGKGGNGSGGDTGGGGGGGACGCWNGTTLAAANCNGGTANGTGAAAPTPNPGAGYVIGGTAATGNSTTCVAANNGSPGYLSILSDSKTALWVQKTEGGPNSGASLATASFASAVTSGNLIVCAVGEDSSNSVTSITGGGNTFIKAIGPTLGTGAISGYQTEVWYSYNSAAGTYALTANFSGASSYTLLTCHEYSGIVNTADPLGAVAYSNTASTSSHQVTIIPTTAHVLRFIVGFFGASFSTSANTTRSTLDGDFFGESISHTLNSYTSTVTTSSSTDGINQVVTFKIK